MKMQSLSFFITFLLLLLHNLPILSADSADPPVTESNATEFIRTSCSQTRNPDVCCAMLIGYANAIQNDPTQLALTAISVSLSHVQDVASYISNLSLRANETSNNDHLEMRQLRGGDPSS
ncbi:pectinesterase inhibitor 11-like [Punica granatum]|uniref:Pectinesterase inhibitor 11-like n=1 Tax=Punica granatum TaxID=22663 RepID=A0A6P8CRE0_PUNGR|nr:pectinesterase inhibitor 11-like [Punica granatum]